MSLRHLIRSGALVLICVLARRSVAQSTTSLIPDATVLPHRAVGFRLLTSWTRYDQLIGVGDAHNIAASLNTDSLGSALVPSFAAAENAIRTASGLSNFRLTAGNLVAIGDSRIVTAPLIAQYGLTSRLTLGIVVPLVETRTTLFAQLNTRPGLANVGPNPAFANPGQLGQNAALVTAFRNAATSLQQKLTACQATPTTTDCATLLAQAPAAQSLIQTTSAFAGAIETLYGTDDTHPGQRFVPIAGGPTQLAIDAQMQKLITEYQSFLGGTITGSVVAAGGPGARAAFQDLLKSFGRDSLQSTDRSSIGDISVGATYQLANTFGDTSLAAASATRYRVAVNGTLRIGTGQPANRQRLLDVGTGYGQNGIQVGGAADVQFGRRYSMTATGSYTLQLGTVDVTRLANPGNALLPLDVSPLNLGGTYTAGNVIALSIVPRMRVAEYFGVTGQYSLVHSGADQYTLTGSPPGTTGSASSASLTGLGVSSATAHQVGFGVTYSTIVGRERGPGRLPFEASFSHLETISASGGPVAKTFRDQIELRVYFLR
ncbi:MAG TPA: hypothetical protein VF785_21865 [Gemmatimonadaceae bacterium]